MSHPRVLAQWATACTRRAAMKIRRGAAGRPLRTVGRGVTATRRARGVPPRARTNQTRIHRSHRSGFGSPTTLKPEPQASPESLCARRRVILRLCASRAASHPTLAVRRRARFYRQGNPRWATRLRLPLISPAASSRAAASPPPLRIFQRVNRRQTRRRATLRPRGSRDFSFRPLCQARTLRVRRL